MGLQEMALLAPVQDPEPKILHYHNKKDQQSKITVRYIDQIEHSQRLFYLSALFTFSLWRFARQIARVTVYAR